MEALHAAEHQQKFSQVDQSFTITHWPQPRHWKQWFSNFDSKSHLEIIYKLICTSGTSVVKQIQKSDFENYVLKMLYIFIFKDFFSILTNMY